RGRIITPLKDRFGAEVRTHYPVELDDEIALVEQESELPPGVRVPGHLVEAVARFTRLVRESPSVDERSGVSARFAIAALETVAAAAERRAALTGERRAVARVCDLPSVTGVLRGKVEFDVSEEGREAAVLEHLLRRAVYDTFRRVLGGVDLGPLTERFSSGATVESGELVGAEELLKRVGPFTGLAELVKRVAPDGDDDPAAAPGYAAAAVELALEGLYLSRRLSKDALPDGARYRT